MTDKNQVINQYLCRQLIRKVLVLSAVAVVFIGFMSCAL